MDRLKDKVALVTGSSRGIGAAIAALFAREGAKVALHGRDTQALSAVLADIAQAGGEASYVTADTTKFSDIETMRRRIEREFGPVDILVASAGGSFTTPGPIEQTTEEEWRASIDGNLTATFLTIKSFLPRMKERRTGSIITMPSAAARRPYPMSPIAYAAAKAGIEILTQDLARTWRTQRSISRLMTQRGSPALSSMSPAARSWSGRRAVLSEPSHRLGLYARTAK